MTVVDILILDNLLTVSIIHCYINTLAMNNTITQHKLYNANISSIEISIPTSCNNDLRLL